MDIAQAISLTAHTPASARTAVESIPRVTDTHCPFCALQCGMRLIDNQGQLSIATREFPTNKGGLCRKGWTATALIDSKDRLTVPMIRRGKQGPLLPCSWDAALNHISQRLIAIRESHGASANAVYGGGGLTNEKAYLLGKFARVALGTSNIDYNGRFCMSSAAAANLKSFGLDRGLPFPIEDIVQTEVIMLGGGNPATTMPPVMQYFDEQRERGGKLIVVDPRLTSTAERADLHLQLTPGTDSALLNAMLHIVIQEGLCDESFIAERTSGFESVKQSVAAYWPERIERITGVSESQMHKAVQMMSDAASAMVLTARGAEQHSHGVDNVLAYINFILALGKAGRDHCGYGCLTGQGNGQGGREHGQKSDQLPGYRRLDNVEHRETIARIWQIDADSLPSPGSSACEMFAQFGQEDGIQSLLVMGSNPVVSAPDAGLMPERLRNLSLLVVADSFLSETAELADVVLPVAQWAEESGTMTNLEGRVLLRRAARKPPSGVWTDLQILAALAQRLDCPAGFEEDPEAVFEDLRLASAGGDADYQGISYSRIERENGVFWPCPDESHKGTPRLFSQRFATNDGRARFHSVHHVGPVESPDQQYPLYLTTGRALLHYQTGVQTHRVPELEAAEPDCFVEVHPDTAGAMKLLDGDMANLVSRRGKSRARVRITRRIRPDTVFMPFHWSGQGNANNLTRVALDPVSKMPEFKVCAVRIEPSASSLAY